MWSVSIRNGISGVISKRTIAPLVVQRLDVVPVPGSYGSYFGTRRDSQALDRNNIAKELDCVGCFESKHRRYQLDISLKSDGLKEITVEEIGSSFIYMMQGKWMWKESQSSLQMKDGTN